MVEKILFHEKCNEDLEKMVVRLRSTGTQVIKKFEEELIEVYQRIYENTYFAVPYDTPAISSFYSPFKYLEIPRFDCIIMFTESRHRVITILGIIPQKRSWR